MFLSGYYLHLDLEEEMPESVSRMETKYNAHTERGCSTFWYRMTSNRDSFIQILRDDVDDEEGPYTVFTARS